MPFVLTCLSCALVAAGPSWTGSDEGLVLRNAAGQPVVAVGYRAADETGTAVESGAARVAGDQLGFELHGPAAEQVTLTAEAQPRRRGVALVWRLHVDGPARKWNGWTSGLTFRYLPEVTGARTMPVTEWVQPTGAHPWEVPGDTPYPDTEWQLRIVLLGDQALVMATSAYDPDWLYQGNLQRVTFGKFVPPAESPGDHTMTLAMLLVPADELDPIRLAAEAAGRPVSLAIRSDRVGNLFRPGEDVHLTAVLSNVTDQPRICHLGLEAWSYQGRRLIGLDEAVELKPLERRSLPLELGTPPRGVVFVAGKVSWVGGEQLVRATAGIVPERRAEATDGASPFGMAAAIANPSSYPDQPGLDTVLGLMERIGVRWIRGGWYRLQDRYTEADDAEVRRKIELLRQHGILPHVQLGASQPAADQVDEYQAGLTAALQRYSWVSPWVEVGNELNHAGVTPQDYVDRLLRPTAEVQRQVMPQGQVLSMGLGGVTKPWLDGLVAAGGMDLVDVLSVHPGCQPRAPEFWEGWRGWVFRPQMLDATQAAREHGGKAVWISEAYAPTPPGRSGVDLRTSADYLVRTYVCALALGVQVTEWYQFQDGVWFAQRQRPDDPEYNFGVVYTDLTPKPAYVAYAAMTEQLAGARYEGRVDLGADDLYDVRFQRADGPVDVLWSYRERHETDLAWWPPEQFKDASREPGEPWVERWRQPVAVTLAADGPVIVTDVMGNARRVEVVDGKVRLGLTGSPVYVLGLHAGEESDRLW